MATAALPAVSPKQELQEMLRRSQNALHQVAPPGFDVARAARVALAEASRTPELLECTPASIVRSVAFACQLGLEVGGALGQFYLVPFRNKKLGMKECTPIVGYKGLVELALQSGNVQSIDAGAVYENDVFEHEWGSTPHLRHRRPPLGKDRGALVGVYAYAILDGGNVVFEVMDLSEVEKVKARSRARDFGPWKTDFEPMAIKTVLRRLINRKLAKNVKVQQALVADQLAEEGGAVEFEPEVDAQLPALEAPAAPVDPVAEALGVEPQEPQQPAPAPAPAPAPDDMPPLLAPQPKGDEPEQPAPKCAACGDTGLNSKGGPCVCAKPDPAERPPKKIPGDPPPPTREYAAPCDAPEQGDIPVNARMGQGKYEEQTYEQVAVEDPSYLARYFANRSNAADVRVQAAARRALIYVGHDEMLKPIESEGDPAPAAAPAAPASQLPPLGEEQPWWQTQQGRDLYQEIGEQITRVGWNISTFEAEVFKLFDQREDLVGMVAAGVPEPKVGFELWKALSWADVQRVHEHLTGLPAAK